MYVLVVLVPVSVAVPPETLVAVVAVVAEVAVVAVVAVAAFPPIDRPEAVPVSPVPGPENCVDAVIVVPDTVPPDIDVLAVNVETVRLVRLNAPNAG